MALFLYAHFLNQLAADMLADAGVILPDLTAASVDPDRERDIAKIKAAAEDAWEVIRQHLAPDVDHLLEYAKR